jgi:hypothetical protein
VAQANARSSGKRKTSAQSTKKKPPTKSAGSSRAKASSKPKGASRNGAAPTAKLKGPATAGLAAAAGVVGGAVLGSRLATKPKKVLGVPVPGTGRNGLAKQVGKAAKQLGELTEEVRAARKKAEDVGKAIS